ncbi:MAG TPA: hypothetical protein VK806_10290 [Bacteroidia bacterium]|jgi:hypothetical protein|nr:hypothetical protein [Bacteroidia bacterium]
MVIVEVSDKKTVHDFTRVPFTIYANDPNWVPHLQQEIEEVFNKKENPYFTHGDCIRWVMYDDNKKPIGRVAAFINNKTAFSFAQPTGGMGFFECINDKKAAFALFGKCKEWLSHKGMKAMDGPINFGEKDRYWGLLAEGKDKLAIYGMNHHPEYYKPFFEEYGFAKEYEQIVYSRSAKNPPNQRLVGLAERVRRDPNYRFESLKKANADKYAEDFRVIYNKAWKAERVDFEEMTKERSLALMRKLRPVIDEDICWYAYYKDEPIGVYISLPELNEIFQYVHGNFNWWGKLKFLWYQKTKGCKTMTGMVFGIIPEYQGKGVEAAMFNELGKVILPKNRYDNLLISWIGSFNEKMIHILVALLQVVPYKIFITYRKIF